MNGIFLGACAERLTANECDDIVTRENSSKRGYSRDRATLDTRFQISVSAEVNSMGIDKSDIPLSVFYP